MAGRSSRFAQVDNSSLITGGVVVFDGSGLSCPGLNTATIDDKGNLNLKGKVVQANPVTHVKDVHEYKIKDTDSTILVDSQQGEVTLTLPEINSHNAYQEYTIKDSGGVASKCSIIVQTASEQDMIQTGCLLKITHDYGIVKLLTDGSQWLIMSEVTQLRPWRVRFV